MKIYIVKKSAGDIKGLNARCEYDTSAETVGGFIAEMVERNYAVNPIADTRENCVRAAQDDFTDGGFYIVNVKTGCKYAALDEHLNLSDGDEIALIKLKMLRGIILW